MENLREMITKRQNEIASGDLDPSRAADILSELSALYGNVLDEVRARQMEYSRLLLSFYDMEEKANRARLKAEATPEYESLLEAKDTKELTLEMIRALKYLLRAKESEKHEELLEALRGIWTKIDEKIDELSDAIDEKIKNK